MIVIYELQDYCPKKVNIGDYEHDNDYVLEYGHLCERQSGKRLPDIYCEYCGDSLITQYECEHKRKLEKNCPNKEDKEYRIHLRDYVLKLRQQGKYYCEYCGRHLWYDDCFYFKGMIGRSFPKDMGCNICASKEVCLRHYKKFGNK